MNRKIKLVVIGCGYWGKNLIRCFARLGVLFGVCDTNPMLAEQYAKEYNVANLSLDDVIYSQVVMAVAVATPAVTHYNLAKQLLLAGKDVFVEKPLALSVIEAQEINQIALQSKRILMVGHLLQYHQAFIKLMDLIDNNELGEINYAYSNRLNLGKLRKEENTLWSFAPHDISMILAIMKSVPIKIDATGSSYLNKAVEDITMTQLYFENGKKAHVYVSWLHPIKEQKLIVIGSKAMAVFNDCQGWDKKLALYESYLSVDGETGYLLNKPEPRYISLQENEPLITECQHFLDCVESRKQPKTNGEEGINVLRVLEEADNAMKQIKLELENKKSSVYIHPTSEVSCSAHLGDGVKVWHFSHVMDSVTIGQDSSLGQNVFIGPDVTIGRGCKIQNNVSIYAGVTLKDHVFCGPSCVFTNVLNPRAHINRKQEFKETVVEDGVTIGANATIVCGNTLGQYSMIGAGAVVTKDVKPFALMAGVPARQMGWVSHEGEILDETLICPRTGTQYVVNNGELQLAVAEIAT